MKIKILYLLLIFILNNFILSLSYAANQKIVLDVTEIEILDNGATIKGLNKGTATTDDGIRIDADFFIYYKNTNILNAESNVKIIDQYKKIEIYADQIVYEKDKEIINANGNVKIIDFNKNIELFADNIVYEKNNEIINTNKNSKVIYEKNKIITADKFQYNRNKGVINAINKVYFEDTTNDYKIIADYLSYFQLDHKIISEGFTTIKIKNKYKIESDNLVYLIKENNLSSNNKTKIIDDKSQIYYLDKFNYSISDEILKGEKILIVTNYNLPKSDKFFFENGIIDLKNKKFTAKDAKINIHKNIFDNSQNDPRLEGISVKGEENLTIVNKGIFTSCNDDNDCPPWSLRASKIEHDKKKKQLNYENAVLQIYDVPVFYFPKFFHPDPTVVRQSGFLKPELNNSNILGSSITIPYYKVISENKDFTFKPTLFESNQLMIQSEYRQINKDKKFIADIGFVNNYKSTTTKKTKNLSHVFAKFDYDLKLENFISSNFSTSIERVSNNTYLKIFNSHITKSTARPNNFDKLNNNIKLFLINENYSFETGFETYETLDQLNSDRYQYILPYYNFDRSLLNNHFNGNLYFSSSGSNDLNQTNNLKTSIINDLNYNSESFISNKGFKSNFHINLKNLNSIGKKTSNYKSSPQMELIGQFNAEISLPLQKIDQNYNNLLTPKLSFRFNPSDMKNYTSSSNIVDVNNIFSTNRLSLSDTFESGRSLTLGLDFKKEKNNYMDSINKYFQFKLATVLRDKEEDFVPKKSTLNKKNSNLFGLIHSQLSDNFDLTYKFSLDNDYSTLEYNDINATFSLNNIVTSFSFIEENGERGDTNVLQNSLLYNFDDNNSISFNTRRNRKLNLTEYYDLVYQYKNDCLTAGVKYNKTYYSDGDLKPSENLLFTITLFPLTTYEYNVNEILEN